MPLLAASLLATGCSYHHAIVAVERAGAVIFVSKDGKGTGCLSSFSVTDKRGRVVWRLNSASYLAPPCQSKFPITYGVKPAGMSETVKAIPLQRGSTYKLEGWDGDSYSGLFRLKLDTTIENLPESQ